MLFQTSTVQSFRALPRALFLRPGLALAIALVGTLWPAAAQALTIAWDPNTDGVTAGYYVSVGLAPGAPLAVFDAGTASHIALPLPVGSRYFVAVSGYGADRRPGPTSPELPIDLSAAPGRPEGLAASVSGAVASLSWAPPSTGGVAMTYLLSAGTTPGAANLLNGLPVGLMTTASGALPAGTYYARVHAANFVGVGPASQEISFQIGGAAALGPPTGLRVTWSGRRARFSWSAPAGAVQSYVLEAGTGAGASNIGAFNIGSATSFTIDVPAGTYYVRVRAVGAAGLSAPSNEIVVR